MSSTIIRKGGNLKHTVLGRFLSETHRCGREIRLWSVVSQDCVGLLESLPPRWSKRAGRCRQWGTSCFCFGSVGSPSHGTGRASRASRGARVLNQHCLISRQKSITRHFSPPQVTLTVCGGPHRKNGRERRAVGAATGRVAATAILC